MLFSETVEAAEAAGDESEVRRGLYRGPLAAKNIDAPVARTDGFGSAIGWRKTSRCRSAPPWHNLAASHAILGPSLLLRRPHPETYGWSGAIKRRDGERRDATNSPGHGRGTLERTDMSMCHGVLSEMAEAAEARLGGST